MHFIDTYINLRYIKGVRNCFYHINIRITILEGFIYEKDNIIIPSDSCHSERLYALRKTGNPTKYLFYGK